MSSIKGVKLRIILPEVYAYDERTYLWKWRETKWETLLSSIVLFL